MGVDKRVWVVVAAVLSIIALYLVLGNIDALSSTVSGTRGFPVIVVALVGLFVWKFLWPAFKEARTRKSTSEA